MGHCYASSSHRGIIATCIFLLQGIPLTTGHLRHSHSHHHHHDEDDPSHVHSHDHHHHRRTNSLESDFTSQSSHGGPDIFDSCVMPCYGDIVDRYGVEFAQQLKADGFHYEECKEEEEDADALDHHHHTNSTTEDHQQQRALNRILGATNQLHRTWSLPQNRASSGHLHIPYAIKSTAHFTPETLSTISKAMAHIETSTGVITFVPKQKNDQGEYEGEHIYFNYMDQYKNVCAANLGKQWGRATNVFLGWCRYERNLGNIVHEILHAMGFWHEHSRPDRDEHVFISFADLQPSAVNNFKKATMVNSLGSPYDYNSIMHYPALAFSTNRKPTIIPTKPMESWEVMGQRVKLSDHDVNQLRLLYQCKDGPRDGGVTMGELCSEDCKCWEHALGECSSDSECMGDLVCSPTPTTLPTKTHVNELPTWTGPTTQFSCNDYCHEGCCGYPVAIFKCPETCNSAPPVRELTSAEIPSRMCVSKDADGGGGSEIGTTGASVAATSTTTTTTVATTTTTAFIEPPWYFNLDIDKCVQFCSGPPPCGGFAEAPNKLYLSVQECCSETLDYKPFQECHTIPEEQWPSGTPSNSPSESLAPSLEHSDLPSSLPSLSVRPSKAPITESPTDFPSEEPTMAPTTAMPTRSPSASPTNNPTTEQPSKSPTRKPTNVPSKSPTKWPSKSPVVAVVPQTRTSSGEWYVDWDLTKCVRDCIGAQPCRSRRKEKWEPGYGTVQSCCDTLSSYKPFNECSYEPSIDARAGTVTPGNGPADTRWYPGTSKCLNDGNAPSWQHNMYESQSTCCSSSRFNWDYKNCMGLAHEPSQSWYMSWSAGKCVKDCDASEGGSCGGLIVGSWVVKHGNADACCNEHMSSAFSKCMGN